MILFDQRRRPTIIGPTGQSTAHTTMTQTWKEELICEDQAIVTQAACCLWGKSVMDKERAKIATMSTAPKRSDLLYVAKVSPYQYARVSLLRWPAWTLRGSPMCAGDGSCIIGRQP